MSQPALEDEKEFIICPSCGELVEGPEFCEKCVRPLGPYTNFDPIRQLQGEGFALRGGIRKAQNPIVLVAMWLICIPAMASFLWAFRAQTQIGWSTDSLVLILSGGGAALYAFILIKATRNYLRAPRLQSEEGESQ